MDLREYQLFAVPVHFYQATRRQINQEESEHTGWQRVSKVFHVLARYEEMAISYAIRSSHNKRMDCPGPPQVIGEISTLPIDGIVLEAWFRRSEQPQAVLDPSH